MRAAFTLLHRWFGLLIAAFLFVAGVTGAIIAWEGEIDALLNPHLMQVESRGDFLPSLSFVDRVETADPHAWVVGVPLGIEAGKPVVLSVAPRVDPATGRSYALDYNQVFFDPVTGKEMGRRDWGAIWPITTETFTSFLYLLHYSLHIPSFWGIDRWGIWLMGGIAIVWTVDCFVAFYLTLPRRRQRHGSATVPASSQPGRTWWTRWGPAWRIKTGTSTYRINFDIHRAFGLWLWIALLILAISSVSLNLSEELVRPIVRVFSDLQKDSYATRKPRPEASSSNPKLSFSEIVDLARTEAERRGSALPVGSVFYERNYGIYSVYFYPPDNDRGVMGAGAPRIDFDAEDGSVLGQDVPWTGSAGDLFLNAQFPLHSGRILGLPGRIFISFMGIVVAALSVTGVVIWHQKRAVRVRRVSKLARRNGLT